MMKRSLLHSSPQCCWTGYSDAHSLEKTPGRFIGWETESQLFPSCGDVPQCPPVRHNTGQDAEAEEQSVSLASRARRTLIVAEILMTQDCQLSDGPGC